MILPLRSGSFTPLSQSPGTMALMFGPNRQSSLRILPEDGRDPETGESTGEHIFFDDSDPASRERAEELVRARFGVEIGELLSSERKREPLLVRWRKLFRRAS